MNRLGWVAGVLVLLGAGYLWAARTPVPSPPPQAPQPVQAVGTKLVVRQRGSPQVALQAQKVTTTPDLSRATLEGIGRAVVYREGKEFLRVRAQRIVFNRKTQNFVAEGGVEVASPDGDWLRAPRMVYLNEAAVLDFPEGAEFQMQNHQARVRRLRYYVRQDVVEMSGGADVLLDLQKLSTPAPKVQP